MLVLGDAHADDRSNRQSLLAAYDAADADAALQTGDLGHYDIPCPTWFVAGNNEDFDVIDRLRRGERPTGTSPHLRLLASTVETVSGLEVAGLSGNFAPTQYDRPRSSLEGERRRHFVRDDLDRLLAVGPVDVLLVHAAPHGLLYLGYDPGCEPIDTLVRELSPALCLVGHYHRHTETTIDGTRVVSLAPVWDRYYTLDPATLALEAYQTPSVG